MYVFCIVDVLFALTQAVTPQRFTYAILCIYYTCDIVQDETIQANRNDQECAFVRACDLIDYTFILKQAHNKLTRPGDLHCLSAAAAAFRKGGWGRGLARIETAATTHT